MFKLLGIYNFAWNTGFDEEAKQQISFVLQQYEESSSGSNPSSSSDSSSLASTMATMSSLSDDGYEEDEESNVSQINLGICWSLGGWGGSFGGPLGVYFGHNVILEQ